MNRHSDSESALERRERRRRETVDPSVVESDPTTAAANGNGAAFRNGHSSAPKLDLWDFARLIGGRWPLLLLGAVLGGAAFLGLGFKFIKEKHTAKGQLLRYETPGATDFFPVITAETFVALIRSPELLARVGNEASPPIPPDRFAKIFKVEPESESDLINVVLAARNSSQAVSLLNLYMSNAVEFARQYYADHAATVSKNYLRKQLDDLTRDITALEDRFRGTVTHPVIASKLSEVSGEVGKLNASLGQAPAASALVARQRERLDRALGELDELLSRYTDIHPRVIEKRAQVDNLEQQLLKNGTNLPAAFAAGFPRSGSDFHPEADLIRTRLLALEDGRVQLANRQREAELYAEDPPGIVRVFAPANLRTVQKNHHQIKIGVVTVFGMAAGMLGALLLALLLEFADNRLKTGDDLRRVTRLPVLTSLGDLETMGPEARAQWAFRTWTLLQGRLSPTANHGLVCGITSSKPGEGRSTWIGLLAEAASLTGFRVLTIATRPTTPEVTEPEVQAKTAPEETDMNSPRELNTAITTSVLSAPNQVTERLTGPNPQPMVHIPLPGWVWNLDRRRQWGEALGEWRQIDNLVILVELPPAGVPEAVLLGSNLPNMLWLADSGQANAAETRDQLATLRHARCNLVGAVLNRDSAVKLKRRFARWIGLWIAFGCLISSSASAQSSEAEPDLAPELDRELELVASPAAGFSISKPAQRAEWQKHLTLGPGDVLTIGLFGEPESVRTDVAVGPDGRISFLEASDILAAGRSVDELRAALDQALGQYRRAARTMITPVAFKSKRYYVLGRVMTKGVYVLDRPLTILEAIARAHGLENALVDRNLVDLADFQRSFLARKGQRIPVNFDQLFARGDLSQNIPIEPDDYLYLASAQVQEVYVVGEVRLPGPVVFTPELTAIRAITSRGGYTERAFKSRVLVIRGPLNRPEPFVVDTRAVLRGESTDFKLQPRDIIYVNSRPFIRVEELADLAATAFIQSIITEWVGVDVVKPIN